MKPFPFSDKTVQKTIGRQIGPSDRTRQTKYTFRCETRSNLNETQQVIISILLNDLANEIRQTSWGKLSENGEKEKEF